MCILNKTKNVKKVENKKSELEKKNSVDALNVLFLCVLFAARGEISEQRIDKNIATECEIARCSFHLCCPLDKNNVMRRKKKKKNNNP